ncbi:MAG: sialidase family protein [Oscillospiraceae bacterium]
MKKLIIPLILCLAFTSCSVSLDNKSKSESTLAISAQPTVSTANDNIIYPERYVQSYDYENKKARLLVGKNAINGASERTITLDRQYVNMYYNQSSVFVSGNKVAYAVGLGADFEIVYSDDAGANWKCGEIEKDEEFTQYEFGNRVSIGFTTLQDGWLVISSASFNNAQQYLRIYTSHDGGISWQREQDPNRGVCSEIASAVFVTPAEGYIQYTGESNIIHRTKDGGKTWSDMQVDAPTGASENYIGMIISIPRIAYDTDVLKSGIGPWVVPVVLIYKSENEPYTDFATGKQNTHYIEYMAEYELTLSADGTKWEYNPDSYTSDIGAPMPFTVDNMREVSRECGKVLQNYKDGTYPNENSLFKEPFPYPIDKIPEYILDNRHGFYEGFRICISKEGTFLNYTSDLSNLPYLAEDVKTETQANDVIGINYKMHMTLKKLNSGWTASKIAFSKE